MMYADDYPAVQKQQFFDLETQSFIALGITKQYSQANRLILNEN